MLAGYARLHSPRENRIPTVLNAIDFFHQQHGNHACCYPLNFENIETLKKSINYLNKAMEAWFHIKKGGAVLGSYIGTIMGTALLVGAAVWCASKISDEPHQKSVIQLDPADYFKFGLAVGLDAGKYFGLVPAVLTLAFYNVDKSSAIYQDLTNLKNLITQDFQHDELELINSHLQNLQTPDESRNAHLVRIGRGEG